MEDVFGSIAEDSAASERSPETPLKLFHGQAAWPGYESRQSLRSYLRVHRSESHKPAPAVRPRSCGHLLAFRARSQRMLQKLAVRVTWEAVRASTAFR